MTEYKQSSGNDKICRLVDSQEQAISNRSKLVDAYIAQSLIEATKNGSNLFNEVFSEILKLLPTNQANLIKTILLVAGIVVVVSIVFLLLIIICKCFSLLWWCNAPLLSRVAGLLQDTRSIGSGVGHAVERLYRRIRPCVQSRYNVIGRSENNREVNLELLSRRHISRTAKAASKIL